MPRTGRAAPVASPGVVVEEPGGGRPLEATVRVPGPFDLQQTLGPLRHGRRDPCVQADGRLLWRATRTPAGPATQALVADPSAGTVRCFAWGPGAPCALDRLGALVGADDDTGAFAALLATRPPGWEVVAPLARRHAGLRIPRSGAVLEATVPAVLAQRVTGVEAARSHRELVAALGEPAPGPRSGLRLPPRPERLAATPVYGLARFGVERKRAETLRRVASAAAALEATATLPGTDGRRRLQAVPGVGPWTAAEVARVALGDPDALSVGDFHLPNQVAWSLTGSPRGDDRLMLELLEPWRGQRGRVQRLLMAGGVTAPKFGPRLPLTSVRDR